MYLDGFAFAALLGSQFLQRRRRHEDDKGHQIGLFQDFQRLRVQVEDAKLSGRHDGTYSVQSGAVVGFFVFTVLDKLAIDDVGFKLRPRDEVIVLTVDLGIFFRPTRICREPSQTQDTKYKIRRVTFASWPNSRLPTKEPDTKVSKYKIT